MSLSSMIKHSLGITESSGGHMMVSGEKLSTRVFSLLGSSAGCATVSYLNGRMPTPGQDHVVVSFGGKSAPLDLVIAVGAELASMLDLAGGYSDSAHDFARGALDGYLARVFTAYGSEAKVKSIASAPAKQMASGVFDFRRHAQARRYASAG